MLYLADSECFARGACNFTRTIQTDSGPLGRIALWVEIEGRKVQAAIDTGGAYLYCDSEITEILDINPSDGLGPATLVTAWGRIHGTLHRVNLQILADEGESALVDVTAFIPDLDRAMGLDLPTYLGFHNCLELFRLAIDPGTDRLYFDTLHQD